MQEGTLAVQIAPPLQRSGSGSPGSGSVARWFVAVCIGAALAWPNASLLRAQVNQYGHTQRNLSGTVTDPQHEPLRGAVVKLQLGDTPEIITYITGNDGHYSFKRLDSEHDYRVWVTFRNRTSKARDISKFDTHMEKVVDFTIETF